MSEHGLGMELPRASMTRAMKAVTGHRSHVGAGHRHKSLVRGVGNGSGRPHPDTSFPQQRQRPLWSSHPEAAGGHFGHCTWQVVGCGGVVTFGSCTQKRQQLWAEQLWGGGPTAAQLRGAAWAVVAAEVPCATMHRCLVCGSLEGQLGHSAGRPCHPGQDWPPRCTAARGQQGLGPMESSGTGLQLGACLG